MGIFGSKVAALDIPFLVKMLSECQVPVDRNQALDYLEQIDQNLLDKKTLDAQAALFKDADGMRMVVKVGKRLVDGTSSTYFLHPLYIMVLTNFPL